MANTAPHPVPPADGFVVEVGGKFISAYRSLTAALQAGLQLKNENAQAPVKVYEAKERM